MKIPVYRYVNGKHLCTFFVCKLGETWVAVAYDDDRPLRARHWGVMDGPVRVLSEDTASVMRSAVEHSVYTAIGLRGYNEEMLTATLDLDTRELTPWETYAK